MSVPAQELLARLEELRQAVAARVDARSADDPTAGDPMRGLFVTAETATRLAAEPMPHSESEPVGHGPAGSRMTALVRGFGLTELDERILVAALAPDVDRRFEALYGYLNDDVSRRRATVALVLELAGTGPHDAAARARFHPAAPLTAGGLLAVEDEDRPLPGRAVRVPERVVAHLLGDDTLDAWLLDAGVDVLPPGGPAGSGLAARVAEFPRPVAVHLRERRDGGGADAVAAALRGAGRVVLRHRPDDHADARIGRALLREARLRGAGAAVVVEPLPSSAGPLVRALTAQRDVTVVFAGTDGYDPAWAAPQATVIALEDEVGVEDALTAWHGELPEYEGDLAEATAPYRIGGEQARRAARAAAVLADFEGAPVGLSHVQRSARLLSTPLLGRHARRVRPAVGFADLVLPDEPLGMLEELAGRARHRDRVLGEWRLRTGGGRGRGVIALFAGDSGTGKTLAAEVVAGELGLDLYVVDLSSVVDKYVGETEKNLERIFTEVDRTDSVLLFDEADAVFGKRSEVKSSHDRYANLESAYLLQRLEAFDGIAVLTTNLRANIDEAFTRRLDVVVDFPFPDAALRARLWRSCLASAPQDPALDADLELCAKEFELAGGAIRAAAATAAYLAAARGDVVTSADVRSGARREYVKSGRLVPGTGWAP
ncbi:ATP-binding protein [Streptomyces sp. CBMA152]|uniref:AAA family ATPase n=1 Tax=Streptomyces sp. CBMA152 TaxID=1896312 RepID=UPI002948B742|nr:ATP-binding protein [Streptomyces sp. CBMA152]MBD0741181.1 AAA family ATPase [Streptomyces sp. CBMA152]